MPDSGFHPNSDRPVYRETPATEKEKGEASLFQAPGFIRGVLILNWSVCVRPTALLFETLRGFHARRAVRASYGRRYRRLAGERSEAKRRDFILLHRRFLVQVGYRPVV